MIGMTLILAASIGQSDVSFDAFFADFAKKRDGIFVLEARFSQKDVSKEETVESKGAIVYVKPRRIIFRYDQADGLGPTYLIDDQTAYEYEPDISQLQITGLQDNPQTEIFFLGFDNDTENLKKAYDVEGFTPEKSEPGAHGIIIRPKNKDEANFREVRLYLRNEDYLPYRIHITHENETQVDISVTDFHVNGALDPIKTQVTLAEGTKIIKDDQFVETVGPGGKLTPESVKPEIPLRAETQSEGTVAP